jgi:hypothetical protein
MGWKSNPNEQYSMKQYADNSTAFGDLIVTHAVQIANHPIPHSHKYQ